jgi:phosphohistidine phosphatase
MIVYFLRHASAGQHGLDPKKDEKRPLDKTGEKQSRDVGSALAALEVEVDVILSSPLTRALRTAKLAAAEFGHKDKIVTDDAMRPDAGYDQFQDLLTRYGKNKAILLVGHNPSITEFVLRLLSGSEAREWLDFKKGAVIKLEVDGGKASLKWMLTPKLAKLFQSTSASSSRPKTLRK